jgi:hypothetical protein
MRRRIAIWRLLERELAKVEAEVGAEKKRVAEMRKALGEIVVPGCECLGGRGDEKRDET